MIEQSFVLLDRITSGGERKIWKQGIRDWTSFKEARKILGIGQRRKSYYDLKLREYARALENEEYVVLARFLPKSQRWRLYPYLKEKALYVDIETAQRYGDITVLGAYDGEQYYSFVKGYNMEKELVRELFAQYSLFITFNGSSFDIPIIERYFGSVLPEDAVHVDLRHVCARLGLHGGLKTIERILGIGRNEDVKGMCGEEAALLWHEFLLTGDEELVELLLEYNEADCRNLEPLAAYAIDALWKQIHDACLDAAPIRSTDARRTTCVPSRMRCSERPADEVQDDDGEEAEDAEDRRQEDGPGIDNERGRDPGLDGIEGKEADDAVQR